MKDAVNKKRPLSWWRRALLAMVLLIMAGLAALIFADYFTEKQLGGEIIKISKASEPISLLDLQSTRQKAAVDAAAYYHKALDSLPPDDLENLTKVNNFYRKAIVSLPVNQFPNEINERMEQDLAKLRPILEDFDKAATLPLSSFDIGLERGMKFCRTRLNIVQEAALVLSLRTLHLVLQGEDDAAVDSVITMLKLTRVLDSCPTMSLHAAKVVFIIHACKDVHLLLENADPSDRALARLQNALSQTIPPDVMQRIFFAERAFQLELARNLLPEDIASEYLQAKVPSLERVNLPSTRWGRLRLRRASVGYLRAMAELIAVAGRPWPQPFDAADADSSTLSKRSRAIMARGSSYMRVTAETLALVRSTTVAVAVERYRRKQSRLPDNLNALRPAYIDSIPIDPFTGGELLFNPGSEAYAVYSVGANRTDDGGLTVRRPGEAPALDTGIRIQFQKTK